MILQLPWELRGTGSTAVVLFSAKPDIISLMGWGVPVQGERTHCSSRDTKFHFTSIAGASRDIGYWSGIGWKSFSRISKGRCLGKSKVADLTVWQIERTRNRFAFHPYQGVCFLNRRKELKGEGRAWCSSVIAFITVALSVVFRLQRSRVLCLIAMMSHKPLLSQSWFSTTIQKMFFGWRNPGRWSLPGYKNHPAALYMNWTSCKVDITVIYRVNL